MLTKRTKILTITIIALINIVLWSIPSNVLELIAREKPTLLGYYSVEKLTANFIVLGISFLIFYLLGSSDKKKFKLRIFQIIAILILLVPAFFAIDLIARSQRTPRYIVEGGVSHRPPGVKYSLVYNDRPATLKTFPNAKAGYPPIKCKVHIDGRGFRNLNNTHKAVDKAEMIAIGDSFTEGSNISDEHPWRVLFAKKAKTMLYNLGMSGTDPQEYLATLKKYGLPLKPKVVFCMIYEGNDFRGSGTLIDQLKTSKPVLKRFRKYLKESPVTIALKGALINIFGPINANSNVKGQEIFDWIPVAFPKKNPKYYAFPPKRLIEHYHNKKEFLQSPGWKSTYLALTRIQKICKENKMRLLLVYAPTKTHVILPLLKDVLPAAKIRSYVAIRKRKLPKNRRNLPPAKEFLKTLISGFEIKEEVTHEFCKSNGIEFISLTKALRQKAQEGKQIYFTYDQHWTPVGNEVVAEEIYKYWEKKKSN